MARFRVSTLIVTALAVVGRLALVGEAHGTFQETKAKAPAAAPPAGLVDREKIEEQQLNNPPRTTSVPEGKATYTATCSPCHVFASVGTAIGPDLTTVNTRLKKKDILESILFPSRTIVDKYQAELFRLTDGSVVSGLVVKETDSDVQIRSSDDPTKPKTYQKSQIQNRRKSTVSLMPEGLADRMTPQQLANLVAFLLAGGK